MNKICGVVGVLSLILAALAYFPSIAPFTPAILISVSALIGAAIGGFSGWARTAILTIYIVFVTFLVSPISSGLEKYVGLDVLIKVTVIFAIVLAVSLFANYLSVRRRNSKV